MRILLHKRSNTQHVLEIVRGRGEEREHMECETRSYLMHDLLHYAVEGEARLESGFWGNLVKGKTLVDMNDRTGRSLAAEAPGLMAIERVVGALSGVVKGRAAADILAALREYEAALGEPESSWLTEALIVAVQERMRRLLGRWSATPFGSSMELSWPP
jgi:hypothetical protein